MFLSPSSRILIHWPGVGNRQRYLFLVILSAARDPVVCILLVSNVLLLRVAWGPASGARPSGSQAPPQGPLNQNTHLNKIPGDHRLSY